MAKKRREPTFNDLLKEPTWSELATPKDIRLGTTNRAGDFFDPAGNLLTLAHEEVSLVDAQTFVDDGAIVAFEPCGCGGGGRTGCTAEWFADEAVASIRGGSGPAVTRGKAPTWIDVWKNEATTVVYAHGDVEWGDLF